MDGAGARHGRDQRLRPRHRQGRHALRRPLPDAGGARRVLPGVGPRRARRRGRRLHPALPAQRQGGPAVLPRRPLPGPGRRRRSLRRAAAGRAPTAPPWTLETLHGALDRPKAKLQVALRLLRHRGVVAPGPRRPTQAAPRPASTPMRSTSCSSPTATSARATGRCSSAWSSTGRPASAAGRSCSSTSTRPRASARAATCDNCLRIAAAVAVAERERRADSRSRRAARPTPRRQRRCPSAASWSACRATAAASSMRSTPRASPSSSPKARGASSCRRSFAVTRRRDAARDDEEKLTASAA